MLRLLAVVFIVCTPALALAQAGGGGGGGAGGGGGGAGGGGAASGGATGGAGGATGGTTAAPRGTAPTSPTTPLTTNPGTGASTPSQQNLDIAPPTRSLPNAGGGNRVAPPTATGPNPTDSTTGTPQGQQQGQQFPPSGGGAGRAQPGGANSSQQSRDARTGKNPSNETYTSCLRIWDAQTHMTRAEWSRACKRVANRLQGLSAR